MAEYLFDRNNGWRMDLPSYIEPGTRVLCLYRVSTDKQLYHNDKNEADIPMQRIRCRNFAEQQGWTIVCELQEEGVSGHKVRAENRDRIQMIKEYANQKKFDILLVFMFDRIGRIADETPFVVEWFVRNGIRVWSAQEGEQRFETHTDKLTNYIRFWQADGESEKTSIRTSNSMAILTEQGCFTGGLCPYGYQFVKTGRTNKRKQEVNDLVICEAEAYVVRLMFRLAREEGYGAQRIANYLNAKGIKNRSGKNWHPSTIHGVLKNILYTGILRSGKSRSEVLESIRIIDDGTFQVVQKMLVARSRTNEKYRSVPLNTRGMALLSGNIFCGHCGARLCITTSGKGRPKADGTDTVRVRYVCQTKTRTHGDCDGQTGYTVSKLDGIIDSIVRNIFSRVKNIGREDVLNACYYHETSSKRSFVQGLQREVAKADTELQKLKAEIVKALTGQSAFTPELLSGAIKEQENKCAELRGTLSMAEMELKNSEAQMEKLGQKYETLLAWSAAYENASMSAKKIIVSQMIERVDVYRDYHLKLKLNISVEQFLVSLEGFESTTPKQLANVTQHQAI